MAIAQTPESVSTSASHAVWFVGGLLIVFAFIVSWAIRRRDHADRQRLMQAYEDERRLRESLTRESQRPTLVFNTQGATTGRVPPQARSATPMTYSRSVTPSSSSSHIEGTSFLLFSSDDGDSFDDGGD